MNPLDELTPQEDKALVRRSFTEGMLMILFAFLILTVLILSNQSIKHKHEKDSFCPVGNCAFSVLQQQ
jgi:hypothetical protein